MLFQLRHHYSEQGKQAMLQLLDQTPINSTLYQNLSVSIQAYLQETYGSETAISFEQKTKRILVTVDGVKVLGNNQYAVLSESRPWMKHSVIVNATSYKCTCENFGTVCCHAYAVAQLEGNKDHFLSWVKHAIPNRSAIATFNANTGKFNKAGKKGPVKRSRRGKILDESGILQQPNVRRLEKSLTLMNELTLAKLCATLGIVMKAQKQEIVTQVLQVVITGEQTKLIALVDRFAEDPLCTEIFVESDASNSDDSSGDDSDGGDVNGNNDSDDSNNSGDDDDESNNMLEPTSFAQNVDDNSVDLASTFICTIIFLRC